MNDPTDTIRRASGLHDAIGAGLDQFGGFLRCEMCRRTLSMETGDAGYYTAKGWPKCCGHTMRWWTRRQIDDGEVPA